MLMNWFKYSSMAIIAISLFLSILTGLGVFHSSKKFSLKIGVESKSHLKNIKGDEEKAVVLKVDSFYTISDVVECIDTLVTSYDNQTLNIVFIGDSVVRNQFKTFLKFFPDYDRSVYKFMSWKIADYHEDFHATHGLLGIKTSFLWRPMINDKFLSHFKKWNSLDDRQVPYIIFIGATVHHMEHKTQNDWSFEQLLEKELLPVLRDFLAAHPNRQLVWLIQPPSLDKQISIPEELLNYKTIHNDVIHHYNQIVRRIFKGTGIILLEFDRFVKEYIRGCNLVNYKRKGFSEYFFCNDYNHTPTALMFSFTTHLLFKQFCNHTN